MARIVAALNDIGVLDRLAAQDSPVHRIDPRAKVLVTAAFLVATVSFGKYELAALTPLAFFPIALMALGAVPARVLLRYVLLACPFAILVGMFNPVLDRQTVLHLGTWTISGGWVSFASILCRFVLTVSAAMALVATTGFNNICAALERLGAPRLLVAQFLMLYRYLFLLSHEAARMSRAHALRAPDARGISMKTWSFLAGNLLLRAFDRGNRVHAAMLCRGFDGEMPSSRPLRCSTADVIFVCGWCAFFACARFANLPYYLGDALVRLSA